MKKYILNIFILICSLFILHKLQKKVIFKEKFETLPKIDDPVFNHLYNDKGELLNIIAICKPFGTAEHYKTYLTLKSHYKFIGISSYMEFPGVPSNPIDNYVDYKNVPINTKSQSSIYYRDMYLDICEAWLHCFKDVNKYLLPHKPEILISESDFVNFNILKPTNEEKIYDYLYSCPKINENSSCTDWVSYNKNWSLAQKCIYILSGKYNLKGLLIGRQNCKLPDNIEKNITKTGWLDYWENVKYYNKAKFLLLPNVIDASPRVMTEAMACNLPVLVNENIVGGWKYVNEQTGMFFSNETHLDSIIPNFLENLHNYRPRNYIVTNYGSENTGKKLKNFLFKNFKNHLNISQENTKTVKLRNP